MKTDFMERIVIRNVPQIGTVKNVCQSVTVQATRNVTMLSAAHPLQKVFIFLIHHLMLYMQLHFLLEMSHVLFYK